MFRILVQLLSPYRRRVFIAAIALVIAAGTMLAVGQGLRAVIDKGFSAGDPAWLDRTLATMGGLIVLLAGATYLRFYNVSWLGERVTADIRRRIFDHLLTLPPAWFEAGRTGEVISRQAATSDADVERTAAAAHAAYESGEWSRTPVEQRAAILEAEGLRQAAILKAEGEKQSVVLEAEGRKEAAFRDAEAREREAEAEAKATVMVSDSIATSGTQALNYFIAQKYTEAISQFATSPNAKTILFPVEATQLIGSLGGVGELVRDALKGDGK